MTRTVETQSKTDAARAVWVAYGVTVVSALVSLGFSLAALGLHHEDLSYVRYSLARQIVIVLAIAFVGWQRSLTSLVLVTAMMAIIQLCDAGVGALDHDAQKTYGPFGIAVVSLIALGYLLRSKPREWSRR